MSPSRKIRRRCPAMPPLVPLPRAPASPRAPAGPPSSAVLAAVAWAATGHGSPWLRGCVGKVLRLARAGLCRAEARASRDKGAGGLSQALAELRARAVSEAPGWLAGPLPAPQAPGLLPWAAELAPRAPEPAPRAAEPAPPRAAEPAPPQAAEPAPRAPEPAPRAAEPAPPRAAEPAPPQAAEPAPQAAETLPRAAEPLPRAAEPLPQAAEPQAAEPQAAELAPRAAGPPPRWPQATLFPLEERGEDTVLGRMAIDAARRAAEEAQVRPGRSAFVVVFRVERGAGVELRGWSEPLSRQAGLWALAALPAREGGALILVLVSAAAGQATGGGPPLSAAHPPGRQVLPVVPAAPGAQTLVVRSTGAIELALTPTSRAALGGRAGLAFSVFPQVVLDVAPPPGEAAEGWLVTRRDSVARGRSIVRTALCAAPVAKQ